MSEKMDWIAIAQRGFEAWKAKPHNARWWRKIDGTPIPNDVTICIGQEFADALDRLRAERDYLRKSIADKGGNEHAPTQFAYDAACAALARMRAERDEARERETALAVTRRQEELREDERLGAALARAEAAEARADALAAKVEELERENAALCDGSQTSLIVTNWFDLAKELDVPESGSLFDTVLELRDAARAALGSGG